MRELNIRKRESQLRITKITNYEAKLRHADYADTTDLRR
jgi:hypothetical protein